MKIIIVMLFLAIVETSAFALTVTMEAKQDGSDKPTVTGTTNLPDETEIIVSIERSGRAYSGSDKVKVTDKRFVAGPFSKNGAPLAPGAYKIHIVVPYAYAQPDSVQSIIGANGQHMTGKLVKVGKNNLKNGTGNLVIYNAPFKIMLRSR